MKVITQERLKQVISYDRETGLFVSLTSRGCVKAGCVLGRDNGQGYIKLSVDKREYFAHRLAYLYVHGFLPEFVDHINGVRSDNRICNLRPADKFINARNAARKPWSLSRFRGVNKNKKSWYASIRVNGERYLHLGHYANEVEAAYVYDMASLEHHGEHGRRNFLPLV